MESMHPSGNTANQHVKLRYNVTYDSVSFNNCCPHRIAANCQPTEMIRSISQSVSSREFLLSLGRLCPARPGPIRSRLLRYYMSEPSRLLKTAFVSHWLAGAVLLIGWQSAQAAVSITPASGGGAISADTASNAPAPAWTALGPITIA